MKTTKLNFKYIFKGQVFENLSFKSVHVTDHSKIHVFFFINHCFQAKNAFDSQSFKKVDSPFNFFDVRWRDIKGDTYT